MSSSKRKMSKNTIVSLCLILKDVLLHTKKLTQRITHYHASQQLPLGHQKSALKSHNWDSLIMHVIYCVHLHKDFQARS